MSKELLTAIVGSMRYGYESEKSDKDLFILTQSRTESVVDTEDRIDRFFVSVIDFKKLFGNPLILGNITGECAGNKTLCAFLKENKKELVYAVPWETVDLGLGYIAVGERYKFKSPIKAGLRTAMILSHMAEKRDDPFALSDEEKAILIRARTGGVLPDERVGIYRRTLSTENLDKLRQMPGNVTVKSELFALLDEICKEETQ